MNIYIVERREYCRGELTFCKISAAFSSMDAAERWLEGYFKDSPGPNPPDDFHEYPEWTSSTEGTPIRQACYVDGGGKVCWILYWIHAVSLDQKTEPFPEPSPYDGSKLRLARQGQDMSQGELAQKAGFRQKDVSRWENNIYEPTASTLKRLAAAIGCSVDCIV